MTVYILHLETPLKHARHYTGYSENMWTLRKRLEHHRNGTSGCRFMRVIFELGISFTLARVFRGKKFDRSFERKLKNTCSVPDYCPICSGRERPYHPKKKGISQ